MDKVPGLADKSNAFPSFTTVALKFRCSCAYIFHLIYPEKSIWKLILSQTKIFPGSVQQSSVLEIPRANCVRKNFRAITSKFCLDQ